MALRNAIVDAITDLIGETPIVRLSRMPTVAMGEVLVKLEQLNPARTIKDRIALSMIDEAEHEGRLKPGMTIVEPTSGNTGIGLAMTAAARGYRLILTMPDTMSVERRDLLTSYGAEIVLTPGDEHMQGAVGEAERLVAANPASMFMAQQFTNPANPLAHRHGTGPEILDACDGKVDAFVAGVGTGGTITGVGAVLKEAVPGALVVAVEPARSNVLSGGQPGQHDIQGIGAGFVPEILDRDIYDRIVTVEDEDAKRTALRLAREEGILAGISAGANVWAALRVAEELGPGTRIVTVICDSGERYFSVPGFLPDEQEA